MTSDELAKMLLDHRAKMTEIIDADRQKTEQLARAQNLSIYLTALGKDERNLLRPHAIELMLKTLAGVEA